MSYFLAAYRGKDQSIYGYQSRVYILIRKRLVGGYKVTPCRGHGLKSMAGMTVSYKTLNDLVDDWELIESADSEAVYRGVSPGSD